MLLPNGAEAQVKEVIVELSRYAEIDKWQFAFGTPEAIQEVYSSLKLSQPLDENLGTNYVFIVDKEQSLRCADDKELKLYNGYDATSVSVLHKKMDNDVTVLLFEYNAALKSNYKINRRDSFLKINQKDEGKNKSYIGITFIILIFGIFAMPKIIDRISNDTIKDA